MHDEQALIVCRLRIAERLAEAERLSLIRAATGTAARRSAVAQVGGTLVRVGKWLEATGAARQAATAAGM